MDIDHMPDWMILDREGLKRVDYEPKTQKYVERLVDDPTIYLRYDCHFATGYTIGDLCKFVYGNEELKRFIARYSQCRDIEAFHKELTEVEPCDDLDAVELYWQATVFDAGSENSFDAAARMHGCKGEENWYGLDFRSLGEIAHLPIKPNTEFNVYGNGETARLLLSSSREFTLLEVIDALYWEISFSGGPEDRNRMAQEGEDFEEELFHGEPFDDETGVDTDEPGHVSDQSAV
jgi:hypothetical protein